MIILTTSINMPYIHEDYLMNVLDKYVEPVYNERYGFEYHVSVTMKDNTHLPCVCIRHLGKALELHYNELHEISETGIIHRRNIEQEFVQKDVIENFLYNSNIINLSDIIEVETCKYSFPEKLLKEINFNPTHYFMAKFNDGSYENFRYNSEMFFEVPESKNLDDIIEVYNSTLILQNGEIIKLKNLMDWKNNESMLKKIHINKPYFACYFGNTNRKDFSEELERIRKNFRI